MARQEGPVDCRRARQCLDDIRRNRRSQSPSDLRQAAAALGYQVTESRGKGSHWWAAQPDTPRFPIPTGRDPVSVGVTTSVLVILEKVYDNVCG